MNIQVLDRLLSLFDYDVDQVSHVLEAVYEEHCERDIVTERIERIRGYQKQLNKLLIHPGYKQRTPEWYEARKKIVTASELLQATGTPSAKRQFLIRKCSKGPMPSLAGVPAIRHGVIFEDVAVRAYEARNHVKVHEFGLLPNKRIECFGASPDGVCSNGIMLEIKCPYSREIKDGYVKPEYYQQMQGQMHTAELFECDFLECKITLYDSEYHFVEDTHPDEIHKKTALTAKGLEKGAVSYVYDEGKEGEVYDYSPYETSTNGVLDWVRRQSPDKSIIYYRIEVYNCQRISYDESFMEETEPKIRESFALFKKYETNPELIDIDFPETRKKQNCRELKPFAFVGMDSKVEVQKTPKAPTLKPFAFVGFSPS